MNLPLINRTQVREYLLDTAKQNRPSNKFTRVSEETLIAAEAYLRAWCVSRVHKTPSRAKTL